MSDRLHPESMQILRQLVKLHGSTSLINAIHQIVQENAVADKKAIVQPD